MYRVNYTTYWDNGEVQTFETIEDRIPERVPYRGKGLRLGFVRYFNYANKIIPAEVPASLVKCPTGREHIWDMSGLVCTGCGFTR